MNTLQKDSIKIKSVPTKWRQVLKLIGPGIVWGTAAIGSGELIITTKTGSEFGSAFIWALWVGLWFKYWIQKGILDLTVLTGEPILELWNKLRSGKVISIHWILFFLLTMTGVSGLVGLTASAFHALLPFVDVRIWAVIVVAVIVPLAYFQSYSGFEKLMLSIALISAVGAIGVVILARPSVSDIFSWNIPTSLPAALIFLSLLGWGAGSGPDLMIPYSWWVAEKGYPNLEVGAGNRALVHETDGLSVSKVKRWLSIVKWDTIIGYIVTGIVACAFMIAGAAVLKPRGILLEGLDVLTNVSTLFTETYGGWVFGVFMFSFSAALFDTALGVLDGGRMATAHLARMLVGKPSVRINEIRSNAWYRVTLILFALVSLVIFLGVPRPVFLVIFASVVSAVSMPLLAGLVYWSLIQQIPRVYRPGTFYLINLGLAIAIYLFFMARSIITLF